MQDGGHQHSRDGLVEDGVANPDYVDHGGGAEDRQHVGGHALPEVQQEALDLKETHTDFNVMGNRSNLFNILKAIVTSYTQSNVLFGRIEMDL